MRVLVTGSRQFRSRQLVYRELENAYHRWAGSGAIERGDNFQVVHGGAPGADTLANQWCWDSRNLPYIAPVEVHPADWRKGSYAGKIRNTEMVRLGAGLVLAFFEPGAQHAGTRHCLETAKLWLPNTEIKEIWNT